MMPASNIFSIWKIALFGGLLALTALFWLNDHVGYEAKSAILVKGSGTATPDILAETISAFADTETFRERTLRSTRLQESMVGQMDSTEQSELVKNIYASARNKGGLITITSTHADSDVAEVVSTESAETLVRMARLYMGDSEKELSLIVIDRAILSKTVIDPFGYILKSLISAFVLCLFFVFSQPVFIWIKKQIEKIRHPFGSSQDGKETETTSQIGGEERDERFVPQKLDPAFLYPARESISEVLPVFGQPKASEVLKEEVYGQAPKNALQSVSVSMDDLPFTFETPDSGSTGGQAEESKEEVEIPRHSAESPIPNTHADREPTVVEYKRRLNELLSQK